MYPQSRVREPPISPIPLTRLAPSPTGALHLGNAFSFLINWAIARKLSWNIILRIEDLDVSRVHEGMIEDCLNTLKWLGIDWDGQPILQSSDMNRFHTGMQALAKARRVYPCDLSHKQIQEALNAPQLGDQPDAAGYEAIRPDPIPDRFDNPETSWRFIPDDNPIRFHDHNMGPQAFSKTDLGEDFIVWTKRQAPSYQLAVVIDDHASGINRVVRGRDLIDSTPRQLMLYRALGFTPEPEYTHLPLILSPDGRRLAKRDLDTHIGSYSALGGPERVIGLIAHWVGITPEPTPMSTSEFLDTFDPHTLPKNDIVFREEDAQWLRS